ncbi:MAG: hypothetical protein H0X67_03760 [Acidobacteria bacterium]|nr:hypothetical protein [Acidobacteriota bacterium]
MYGQSADYLDIRQGRTHAMVINVQVFDRDSMDIARAKIVDLLRERHRLGPDQEDDFTVQTQEEVAQTATETSRVMTWLLASIAGISLFVGGIDIMNNPPPLTPTPPPGHEPLRRHPLGAPEVSALSAGGMGTFIAGRTGLWGSPGPAAAREWRFRRRCESRRASSS